MEGWLNRIWYKDTHPVRWILYPFSVLFCVVSGVRRYVLVRYHQRNATIPVIVVGNITVGGVGKTPLIIALAQRLKDQGKRVGIVSRGYKSRSSYYPRLVKGNDAACDVGDEPLLLAQKTACPVVISPQRAQAVAYLQQQYTLDLILSDDGLQHYAMGRQMEIAVVDANRGFGNGLCLPAGPLRESPRRLQQVDLVVINPGEEMTLEIEGFYHLKSGKKVALSSLKTPIMAIAAIGNPERFYASLRSQALVFESRSYPDHYQYTAKDFQDLGHYTVIMTEKDAVKCRDFCGQNSYYLSVNARISDVLWDRFTHKLQEKLKNHASHYP